MIVLVRHGADCDDALLSMVRQDKLIGVRHLVAMGVSQKAIIAAFASSIKQGRKLIMEFFLAFMPALANATMPDGEKPLHLAKDLETVNMLLQNGADYTAKDGDGWTPLKSAVAREKLDVMEWFLMVRKTPISSKEVEDTLFYTARVREAPDIVKPLLYDSEVLNKVISRACSEKISKIIINLIIAGISLERMIETGGKELVSWLPLEEVVHAAARAGNIKLFQELN